MLSYWTKNLSQSENEIRRSEKFVLKAVGHKNILVPRGDQVSKTNGLVVINSTAAFVWNLLEEPKTNNNIVREVSRYFSIDRNVIQEDINFFLNEMKTIGALKF